MERVRLHCLSPESTHEVKEYEEEKLPRVKEHINRMRHFGLNLKLPENIGESKEDMEREEELGHDLH